MAAQLDYNEAAASVEERKESDEGLNTEMRGLASPNAYRLCPKGFQKS